MKNEYSNKENYNGIDLTRFICSIMVVMIHCLPLGTSDIKIVAYLNFGIVNYLARIAVPFFFVASGFFLYKKTPLNSFSIEPTLKYAKHLFKLYIIWTLIYFPLSFMAFLKDEKGLIHAVLVYIRDCIFTGSYLHLWYFPATLFAVLLISFLLYKKTPPKKLIVIALFFYLIGLLAQSWFGIIQPLRDFAPRLWYLLKLLREVISTTRNGLFEGFLFVGLGMLFASSNFSISKKKSLIGFGASMFLMFVEVFSLQHFHFIRAYNMFLFLPIATFFGFSFVKQIELSDRPIYRKLRALSALIFYSHLWVNSVIGKLLKIIYAPLNETYLRFLLTLSATIICSLIVIELSEKPRFKWMRFFYR